MTALPVRAAPERRIDPTRVLRAGTVLTLGVSLGAGSQLPWRVGWPAVAALAILAAGRSAVVALPVGRQRWTFASPDAALAMALAAGAGGWVVVAVAMASTLHRPRRRQPRLTLRYQLAGEAAAAAVGGLVWQSAGMGPVGAGLGMAGFWLTRHVALAIAVGATSNRSLVHVLASRAAPGLVQCAGSASVGMLAGWLVGTAPYGLIGLVVPLLALRSAHEQERRRATEARLFAELARGQEQASGRSLDQASEALVIAAARLLGGADVEMLLTGGDFPGRYVGNEYGVPEHQRVDPTALDAPWVLQTLSGSGVCTGCEGKRPYLSVQIGAAGRPIALLIGRRPPGSAVFQRDDVALATILSEQAAMWLSTAAAGKSLVGDAADLAGPVDSTTASALVVVNQSAARLARLTAIAGDPGRVVDILAELYAVERGVASLVGTVAPASGSGASPFEVPTVLGLVGAPTASGSTASPDTDWTTSGVLPPVTAQVA